MITKFNDFINESLLNKMKGKSEEEAIEELNKLSPSEMAYKSAEHDFVNGVINALEQTKNRDIIVEEATTIASQFDSLNVLKYLIEEEGANLNGYFGHNLIIATQCNSINIVKYLLSKGADVHINKDGALYYAVKYGYIEIIEELLKYGAYIYPYNLRSDNVDIINLLKQYKNQFVDENGNKI